MKKIRNFFVKYLAEFVYGSIDGVITTFAVVAGAAGGSLNTDVVLILGFANLFADGFSMSVGNFLSRKSEFVQDLDGKISQKKLREIRRKSSGTALATLISFVVLGSVPLRIFVWVAGNAGSELDTFLWSSVLAGAAFVLIGILKARALKQNLWNSIAETLALGAIAAVLSFVVARFLESAIG